VLTRYSTTKCPSCGHEGKPKSEAPNAGILGWIPGVVGLVATAHEATATTLHCANCGVAFTDSIQQKAIKAAGTAKTVATQFLKDLKTAPSCPRCGSTPLAGARFCAECGMPIDHR
jgi:ribosomal protein L32